MELLYVLVVQLVLQVVEEESVVVPVETVRRGCLDLLQDALHSLRQLRNCQVLA